VDKTGVAAAALLLLAFGGGMQLWTNPAWLPIVGLAVALLVIAALGGADLRRALGSRWMSDRWALLIDRT
jgi:peptidoglycan/LPS O-acetylase OafA/YrhL